MRWSPGVPEEGAWEMATSLMQMVTEAREGVTEVPPAEVKERLDRGEVGPAIGQPRVEAGPDEERRDR